jgi:hypothetical protein
MSETFPERFARVRDQISSAAHRAGRDPKNITLIAVTKTFDAATVQLAIDAGGRDFGENRVQEAAQKIPLLPGAGLRWHLIGHLQSNKARQAVTLFDVIHSVDSRALVEKLDRIAGEAGKTPAVLVQIDLGHEVTKSGASEAELPEIVDALDRATHLQFEGLMTLPPFFEHPENTRPFFRRLRSILEELNRGRDSANQLRELSMGMSHDFEVAIEEGATMVRLGTALFGSRANPGQAAIGRH